MTTPVAVSGPCLSGPNPDSDADLVIRLQAGDESAYETLFRTHSGALMAVARRFFGDTHDAAEAVQDAFVSAFKAIRRFQGTSRLGTWLHRIAVNACLMKIRGRRRQRVVPLTDLLSPIAAPEGDGLLRLEAAVQIHAGLEQLPDAYRTVIQLRDLEGLGTGETARRLGTNEAVVKTRLHRARQALRALLEPDFGDDVTWN